jgi:glycosyltransferase involved in cell wall biosynthesis
MNPPLISVLIPTYNRVTTLEQCVRSAQAGGYDRLEIIISDNASTDGTQELARRLAAEDPRIVFLEHASNLGPLPNWRACLERATGDYVHWLWSDDWIEPGFYEKMLALMASRGRRVAMAAARVIDPVRGLWRIRFSMPDADLPRDELLALAFKGMDLSASPAACLLPMDSVRRHFTESIPLTRSLDCNRRAIGCDMVMILGAIFDHGAVAFCPEPLVNFRESADSISCTTDKAALGAHYAWARITWGKKRGLPRRWFAYDMMRLARYRCWTALIRAAL